MQQPHPAKPSSKRNGTRGGRNHARPAPSNQKNTAQPAVLRQPDHRPNPTTDPPRKKVYDPVPFQNGRKWLFLTWDDYPEPATILTGLSGCIVGAIGFSKGSPYSLIGIIGNVLMSISFFLYLFLVFFVNAVLHGL